ncbi:MAG: hypothetical protein ACK2T0_14335, partial [Anaerolineales bacterium]
MESDPKQRYKERYEAAKQHGVKFTRCRVASVEEDPHTTDLILTYIEDGKRRQENFNLVVLSVGFRPPHSAKDLSQKLGIELVPYYIHRGLDTLRDMVDVKPAEFAEWLSQATILPTTSNPGPGDYIIG